MSLTILSAADVAVVIDTFTAEDLTSMAIAVFALMQTGQNFVLPQRTLVHANTYKSLFMPARLSQYGTSVKIVSMPSQNTYDGLPATTLLLDEQTGAVKAVVNARALTALRTAAGKCRTALLVTVIDGSTISLGSLLASQVIGPSKPRAFVVFGAGIQSEAHINLHLHTFTTISVCTIVNRNANKRLKSLLITLKNRFPNVNFDDCLLEDTEHLARIVSSADIICATTPSTQPLIQSSCVKRGTHINLIGSYTPEMVEVDKHTIYRAKKILVDSREACRAEAGEIIQASISDEDLIEIGELFDQAGRPLTAAIDGLKSAGDITIFKSVGIGLMDTVIASLVVNKAVALGVGTNVGSYD